MGWFDNWSLDGLRNMIGDFLSQMIHALFYPIFNFIFNVYDSFILMINELIQLVVSILHIGTTVLNFIYTFLGLFLEDSWTSIIMIQVTIIIFLRIYYFIKGVQVAGTGL